MFQRREALPLLQKAKEFLWPSMGWKRTYKYIKYRLVRLSDSTHKIALGLAIGCGVSFTPLVGTHFIQAGFVTYILRGNVLAAIIGTFVGNPWTFPFMWWTAISFGSFLFSVIGLPAETALPEEVNFSILWDLITHEPLRIFLPWLMGGYIAAIICAFATYYFFYRIVGAAKIARSKARLRRVHKAAQELTGQRK
ncbi:MAG: DUF2062 domain-containing protein [Alphaproteobacteria bacterium]